jgi:DNA polymerase IV (archaeal DinB-like DNA polymerase)
MRIIAHLDMDAFFASIEERDRPRLRGLPIVVGADPEDGAGRGVVSTANYAARAYGIRSALPISTAWKFSEAARRKGLPPAVFLDVNMKKYAEVSAKVMAILRKYAERIEEASVDEAYFEIPRQARDDGKDGRDDGKDEYEAAAELAQKIKAEIREREQLTASVGIGPNKLIAKIASDRQKPDGLTVVREEDAEKFLEPLSVRAIPGVGPKAEERFRALGVRTIKEAKRFSLDELAEMNGKWGRALYERLRGRDDSPLTEVWEAKSIGEQETFAHDVLDAAILNERIQAIAAGVYERFLRSGFSSFRSVTLTVRFSDFKTVTRSATLPAPANDRATIQFAALRMLAPFLDSRENPGRKKIRLIGMRAEKLL